MKKLKHVWKVVFDNWGKYESVGSYYLGTHYTHERWDLNYVIGEETKPKIGKIFVFGTREAARSFKRDPYCPGASWKLLKCNYTGNAIKPPKRAVYVSDIANFWNGNLENQLKADCPEGTLLVDTVIPIEISS